jgi:hypothetical protein
MSKELFKEAIADAKAVREAALANAKAALEEALTPKLQSMLAAKLQEIEEIDEAKEEDEKMDEAKKSEEEKMEEGMYPDVTGDTIQDKYRATGAALEEADEELEEDFDLSEILAELSDEKELDEAKEEDKKEKMDEAEEEEEEEEEEGGEEEEEIEVKDMTIDDLKDLIKNIISQEMDTEMPADEEEIVPVDAMSGEMGPDLGAEVEEDEIDLEELLAELDSLDEADDKEEKMEEAKKKEDKKEKMDEGKVSDFLDKVFGLGLSCVNTYNAAIKAAGGDKQAEKVAAAEFKKCMKEKAGGISLSGTGPVVGGFGQSGKTSADVYESEELAEAIETINTLRSELNEVNLLNAKLLYVNKLFKAKNLTESQKLKVIASFDKATNVKEAKVVFESLESAISTPAKKAIKESLGFASKAAGVAPNKSIVESNDVIARMQKLANIK